MLAAFALSHAGLFLATSASPMRVGAVPPAGRMAPSLVIVLGNVVIIALEGLIVSIQSMRLEYYEFFSKFYSGGGEEYRPSAPRRRRGPPGRDREQEGGNMTRSTSISPAETAERSRSTTARRFRRAVRIFVTANIGIAAVATVAVLLALAGVSPAAERRQAGRPERAPSRTRC